MTVLSDAKQVVTVSSNNRKSLRMAENAHLTCHKTCHPACEKSARPLRWVKAYLKAAMNEDEMRILLRQPDAGLYLQSSGDWSCSRKMARSFNSVNSAFFWVSEKQIHGVEILMAFQDCKYDVVAMVT